MTELTATPNGCEEASPLSRDYYIPCNQPATTLLWSGRDKRAYRMCAACADHNTRRGMTITGPFEPVPDGGTLLPPAKPKTTPADLIAEHILLDNWLKAESKRFDDHTKETRERLAQIGNELLAMLHAQGCNNFKTDFGTASKSVIITPKVEDREAYLKFIGDHWQEAGNEMLQVGAPQKDAVKNWMEAHEGQLPPGVTQNSFTRVNVRRS